MSDFTQHLWGVNITDLNQGDTSGVANVNYPTMDVFTQAAETMMSYFANQGMNSFRLMVMYEHLTNADGSLNAQFLSYIQQYVAYATGLGMTVEICPCQDGSKPTIGGTGAGAMSSAQFADFWRNLAQVKGIAGNPNVVFDLVNEPNAPTASGLSDAENAADLLQAEKAAIAAIRATGAKQEILISAPLWDHPDNFVGSDFEQQLTADLSSSNSILKNNNVVLEFHQYFDRNGEGIYNNPLTDPTGFAIDPILADSDVNIGAEKLQAATTWARANGVRLFLGETGMPEFTENEKTATQNLIAFLKANADVWQGADFYSAATPDWDRDYNLNLTPPNLQWDGTITDGALQNKQTMDTISSALTGVAPKYFYYTGQTFAPPDHSFYSVTGDDNTIAVGTGDKFFLTGAGENMTVGNNDNVQYNGANSNITIGANDVLGVYGSGVTIKATGAGDEISIGGNGQGAANALLNNVYLSNGGKIFQGDNSRLNVTGDNANIFLGDNDTLAVSGSGITINVTGAGNQISVGGNGQNANAVSDANVTFQKAGGQLSQMPNSHVEIYGTNISAALTTDDTLGLHAGCGKTTVKGFGATNKLQFDKTVFADWTHLIAATRQLGANTIITESPNNAVTLLNFPASRLTQNQIGFV